MKIIFLSFHTATDLIASPNPGDGVAITVLAQVSSLDNLWSVASGRASGETPGANPTLISRPDGHVLAFTLHLTLIFQFCVVLIF